MHATHADTIFITKYRVLIDVALIKKTTTIFKCAKGLFYYRVNPTVNFDVAIYDLSLLPIVYNFGFCLSR
jgi:hypothetical protein